MDADGSNRGLTKDNITDYMYGPRKALEKIRRRKGEVIDPEKDLLADGVSSNILRLCIEAMSRNANHMGEESAKFQKRLMQKRVTEQIRHDELKKTIEILREVDQEPGLVKQQVEYKLGEKNDEIRAQVVVANEYHSGKFDPKKATNQKARKKK